MPSAKTTKKATAKKAPAKKKATAKKDEIELISYSIKMVIPTGEYSNIQPEIIVKAKSTEEAHAYIAPHMNKLWKEYYQISKRRVEPEKKSAPAQKTEQSQPAPKVEPTQPTQKTEPSPVSSVAMTKATQAVQSCTSMDALKLIIEQIKNSVKLTEQDKLDLSKIVYNKEQELTFNEIDEKKDE